MKIPSCLAKCSVQKYNITTLSIRTLIMFYFKYNIFLMFTCWELTLIKDTHTPTRTHEHTHTRACIYIYIYIYTHPQTQTVL